MIDCQFPKLKFVGVYLGSAENYRGVFINFTNASK